MSNFVPNPAFVAGLPTSPGVQEKLQQVAEAGLEVARSLAPVATGTLRDSLHVEIGPDGSRRVATDVDYWLFPEFGTSEMDAQPYLRPIIDSLGLGR